MKKPIVIMVIIHDDLQSYSKDQLYADYFAWLKTELEMISQREVLIIMSEKNDAPELSGYNYKHEDREAAMAGWRDRLSNLHSEMSNKDHFDENLIKYLLLTRDNINEELGGLLGGLAGLAYFKSYCAIAAITSARMPAHEIGHMLGATHEDSEVTYDGWWHDSIMRTDEFSPLRGNRYRFSDKNRENIRDYLKQFP